MNISKYFILFVFLLVLAGCLSARYLPYYQDLGSNPYGSYIKIKDSENSYFTGELISVTDTGLIILAEQDTASSIRIIPKQEIKKYYVTYARKSGSRSIPFVISFLHGWFFLITQIINIAASEGANFNYTDKSLPYPELNKFARFPQGIPENINPLTIK